VTVPPAGDDPVDRPSGLGPMVDVQLLAAMISGNRWDLASYVKVLGGSLSAALPAGMIDVEYRRSMGDRLAGRQGTPVRLAVRGKDREIELADDGHGRLVAQERTVVGGVVISRRPIDVPRWVQLLAVELATAARESAQAREALGGLFGG
jgi:hypothetical protein